MLDARPNHPMVQSEQSRLGQGGFQSTRAVIIGGKNHFENFGMFECAYHPWRRYTHTLSLSLDIYIYIYIYIHMYVHVYDIPTPTTLIALIALITLITLMNIYIRSYDNPE